MKNLAPIPAVIPRGSLDSSSTSTVMKATIPGIDALYNGVCVWLTNGVVTSASNFTININGLGAKPVYGSQAAATRASTLFNVNYTALLIYNENRVSGGCWDYVYGYDSNSNTIGYQVRTHGVTMPMDSITYRYRLLFQSVNGKKFVPANNSTSTNTTASRTTIQTPIDPFGLIVYYGTTASVAAGSKPGSSYLWQQYDGISLGYSFNRTGAALTLTASNPIYLKCAPQSNGSAIIDADTPFVQSLPSSEDGKIYIFLGIAAGETTFTLTLEHPVYEYKDGAVRQWTNAAGSTAPSASSATPQALGTAAAGSSTDYSRADHVHAMPSASDVGAISAPASPSSGQVLTYDNGGWIAATPETVPSAYTSNPEMDGTASAGSSTYWAKGDHVHPTDTSRQEKITASGILKGDGNGGVTVATAGTDYGTYSKPANGIPASDLESGVIPTVPSPSDSTPAALGTAAAGSSTNYARADHVHKKPTASEIGALSSSTTVSNVEQNAPSSASSYYYWRPLLVGSSANATEGFNPSTTTDKVYAFNTIECQPSTGTISATFKGNLTGDVTGTASGNQAKINVSGILKGDGSGGVSAAVAGTDYGTYSKPANGIPAADLESGVIPTVPTAYTSDPAMDGTASAGSSTSWAKGDHVHPTDTSRMASALKGAANGVAELDSNGKVPTSQLPSYVDDVIEGYYYDSKFYSDSSHTTEITGSTGKIYVDLSTEKTYRWSGTSYVGISASIALGETSSTAYAGDKGKEAHNLASAALPKSGGTMTGSIAMGSNSITGLATPTNDADAATKAYADTKYTKPVGGIPATDLAKDVIPSVPVAYTSNPIMDGTANAGSSLRWARGDHIHPSDTSKLSLSGGTMSGAIAMGNHQITGLAAPTSNNDAATKTYVDTITGALSGLTTTATGSLVAAINELVTRVHALETTTYPNG